MKIPISNFLKERLKRFKPDEANKLNLKRLQKIDFSGNMHFLENKKTNTNMILIKSGDLVVSGINVEKGAVAVYQGNKDVLATIHYSSYEFDENKIDINYFKWFLKSDAFRKAVQSQTRGGIKTELKPKKFLPLEIDLPIIEQQKEILAKINKVENEIKQLEDNISHDEKLLTALKQSILQEKFSLNNCELVNLGEVIKLVKGEHIKNKKLPYLEARYIRGKKDARVLDKGELVKKGELVILMDGENSGEVFELKEDGYLGSTFKILKFEKEIDKKYLRYFLSIHKKRYSGSKKGIAIPHLDKSLFKETKFPLPPLPEQLRIVEKVDALMKFCDELELRIKENKGSSEQLMNSVLREVFK